MLLFQLEYRRGFCGLTDQALRAGIRSWDAALIGLINPIMKQCKEAMCAFALEGAFGTVNASKVRY